MLLTTVLLPVVTLWALTEARTVPSTRGILTERDFEKFPATRRLAVRVVRDETAAEEGSSDRSPRSDDALPSVLALRSLGKDHDVRLRLRREPLLKVRANLEEVTTEVTILRDGAVYTDPSQKATVVVRRRSGDRLSMEGRWEQNGKEVRISPAADHVTTRNAGDGPDHVIEEFPRDVTEPGPVSVKRNASPQYVLELVLVADFWDFDMWRKKTGDKTIAEMTLYYTFMAKDLQARYRSIKEVSLDVRVVGLEIMTEAKLSPWTSNLVKGDNPTIDDHTALDNFAAWLKDNSSKLPKADNYAAFTSLDFENSGVGLAELGQSCSYKGVSLNKDQRFFTLDALTLAHELGHNLGMEHSFNTSCYKRGDIMSYDDWDPNNWSFTNCSIQSLLQHIKESPCIEASGADVNLTTTLLGGQHMNADAQCATSLDSGSLKKSEYEAGNREKICYSMECCSTTTCHHIQPLDYTDCDEDRWCIQGKCVSKSVTPEGTNTTDNGGSGGGGEGSGELGSSGSGDPFF